MGQTKAQCADRGHKILAIHPDMKQWLRFSAFALGSLLLLAAVFALYLKNLNFNDFKPQIQNMVREASGRALTIEGRINLRLSLRPYLSVKGLHLANARWGGHENMIDVREMKVRIQLLPLLHGQLIVDRLLLVHPDILLETNRQGVGNWQFGAPSPRAGKASASSEASSMILLPQFHHLLLRQARVTYRDDRSGKQWRLEIPYLELGSKSDIPDAPVNIHARLRYGDKTISFNGSMTSLSALMRNRPVTMHVKAALDGMRLELDGSIERPLDASGIKLNVSMRGEHVVRFARLFGGRLPHDAPFQLRALLQDVPDGISLKHLRAELGDSDAKGEMLLRLDNGRPVVTATLASRQIDADAWLAGKGRVANGAVVKKTGGQRLFPDTPLQLDILRRIRLRLSWRVGLINWPGIQLEQVNMQLGLKDGVLRVAPFATRIAGGSVQGNLMLDAHKPPLRLDIDIHGKGIVVSRLIQGEEAIMGGPVDIRINVKGKGNSIAGIMGSLSGSLKSSIGKARVKTGALNLIGGDLLVNIFDKINPFSSTPPYTRLACGVMNFRIRNGLMQSDDGIAFETARMNILSGGTINLRDEEISLSIGTQPREGLGVSLSDMLNVVRIGGTLADPSLTVDVVKSGMLAARVAGAVATGGLSLLGESLYNRLAADRTPCKTALAMP